MFLESAGQAECSHQTLSSRVAGTKWPISLWFQMDNGQEEGDAVAPPPSPSLPEKISPKRGATAAYSATEDTFKDTANLVKAVRDDSEV